MKKARIVGLVLTTFLVVLAAAASWVVFYWDMNRLKPQLTGLIEKNLDREVSIDGDLEIAWALPPALVVNELAIGNSSWAKAPHLVTVQRITATLDWRSLLGGDLRLDRLEVRGASVALEQNDAGQWNLPTAGDTDPKPAALEETASIPLNALLLSDSGLRLSTPTENHQVKIEGMQIVLGEPSQATRGSLHLDYQQIPVSLEATLSPTRALFQAGTALDLDAVATAADNRLAIRGGLASLSALWPLDLRFTLTAPDPAVTASVITVPAEIRAKGLDASGRLQKASAEKPYRLSDLSVRSGANDIGGNLELDLSRSPWKVTATLASTHLDLRPYLAPTDAKAAPAPGEDRSEKSSDPSATPSDGQFFSREPFDLGWLEGINADVSLTATELLLPRVGLADLVAALTLEGGRLDLAPLTATVGGGTIDAALHLAAASAPQIDATLTAKALDLARMLQELGLPDSMHGDLGLKVDLQGQGASPADLAASLDGQLSMVMQEGGMDSRYLQKAQLYGFELTDAFVQLFKAADKEPTEDVEINCLVCRFDLTNGVAESEALVFDTALVGVVGNGQVNLKTETLDIALKPVSDGGIGIPGLAKLKVGTTITDVFKLGGTLSNPSISLDKSEATMSLAKSLGGMLLFGPVGLGAALLDTELGDDNPCVKALKQAAAAGEP